jgi:hypothetical protein
MAHSLPEMPRPIETLLSLPRVRLVNRVPIVETDELIRRFVNRADYEPRLVRNALEVSDGSARQFSVDDKGLSTLLEEINSTEYVVTKRSRILMQRLLNGIYGDGFIFKEFEDGIEPLCRISPHLRKASKVADQLAVKTREESVDLARALMIDLPKRDNDAKDILEG